MAKDRPISLQLQDARKRVARLEAERDKWERATGIYEAKWLEAQAANAAKDAALVSCKVFLTAPAARADRHAKIRSIDAALSDTGAGCEGFGSRGESLTVWAGAKPLSNEVAECRCGHREHGCLIRGCECASEGWLGGLDGAACGLRGLANWFDRHDTGTTNDVQEDLRRWAAALDKLGGK